LCILEELHKITAQHIACALGVVVLSRGSSAASPNSPMFM
jgi:hypothetical protein